MIMTRKNIVTRRQWPEVYDLCHTLRESKNTRTCAFRVRFSHHDVRVLFDSFPLMVQLELEVRYMFSKLM